MTDLSNASLLEIGHMIRKDWKDIPPRAHQALVLFSTADDLEEMVTNDHTAREEMRIFLDAAEDWDGPVADAVIQELTRRAAMQDKIRADSRKVIRGMAENLTGEAEVEALDRVSSRPADPDRADAEEIAVMAEQSMQLVHEYRDAIQEQRDAAAGDSGDETIPSAVDEQLDEAEGMCPKCEIYG